MESGDRIRALLVEMRNLIPQLSLPVSHLNAQSMSRCQDMRLEIELKAIRQSLRDDQDVETYEKFPKGGDRLQWIHTSTMLSDVLTKRMKADLMLQVLQNL